MERCKTDRMLRVLQVVSTAIACVVSSVAAHAATVAYVGPTGAVERIDSAKPGRHAWPAQHAAKPPVATAVAFNIVYQDVVDDTDQGFDHPTYGADARARVDDVLAYLDSLLDESGGLNILFEVSETGETGALAHASTYYWTSPPGFTNGFAYEHIVNNDEQDPGMADMFITVDFGYNFNVDAGDPSGGEFDLFTTLLHELTHGLGFTSLADSDGTSTIGSGVFTGFDDFLVTGSPAYDLFYWTGETVAYGGTAGSLLGQNGGVFFAGANAAAGNGGADPPLYAPSSWVGGSSISHWDDGSDDVMARGIAPGMMRREYSAREIGVLNDIGYLNVPAPPGGEGEIEGEAEGEAEAAPITYGTPVAGMIGLALISAACGFGGAYFSRNNGLKES